MEGIYARGPSTAYEWLPQTVGIKDFVSQKDGPSKMSESSSECLNFEMRVQLLKKSLFRNLYRDLYCIMGVCAF